MSGDVFLLGTTSWRIRRVEKGRVRVEDAHGAAPSIPFWNGEAPGRTAELSAEVARLRADILATPDPEWLLRDGGLDRLRAIGRARPGRAADIRARGGRALLRRRRRHAIRAARSLRRARQSRLGIGFAQAFLPHVQL